MVALEIIIKSVPFGLMAEKHNPAPIKRITIIRVPCPCDPLSFQIQDSFLENTCWTTEFVIVVRQMLFMLYGRVLVAYRDRSEEEIRDISLIRYNGNNWESPVQVAEDNWRIGGCPVNGPAIVSGYGNVAVAWYTEANQQPKVQVAFSEDMGTTFSDPVVVDDVGPLGRVDIAFYNEENVLITWMKPRGDQACIMAKLISIDGNASEEFCLIENVASRQSGFSQTGTISQSISLFLLPG